MPCHVISCHCKLREDAVNLHCNIQVRELEHERLAALEAATAARGQIEVLGAAQTKLKWQSQLLEKMSQVGRADSHL